MNKTLYHYIHCPYCIRVRMALGYLDIPWNSQVLPYRDEETPLRLTGKKMLPILADQNGPQNESLNIIKYLDTDNKLQNETWKNFDSVLEEFSALIYNIAMPFWVWSPEFDPESQKYFLKKKESKRGPFSELIKKRNQFEKDLIPKIQAFESQLKPFLQSSVLTIRDIGLAAQLWGLYAVPEFRFSQRIHDYLQAIKSQTMFNYSDYFWREP